MEKIITTCEAETAAAAKSFAKTIKPGDIIAFKGGLGVGKTTFTRYMCEELETKDDVSSPTFALVHCYRAKIPVCHFDMYRINTFDDLYPPDFLIIWIPERCSALNGAKISSISSRMKTSSP